MTGPSTHQDSPKVPEALAEALAEMRWDEGRNPDADSPRWAELVGCEDMKRPRCDEARADLEELAPFLFSALLSDEVVEAVARRRWNARREAIIQSGTAAGPGLAWDDIEPSPRNGHDIRAAEWNAARDFFADFQAAIEQVGGSQG